jgi:hypothetical protein
VADGVQAAEESMGVSAENWRRAVHYDFAVASKLGTEGANEDPLGLEKWQNKEAVRAAARAFENWGPPSSVGTQTGGSAVWHRVAAIRTASDTAVLGALGHWIDKYEEVVIDDTVRPHASPMPHVDFMTFRTRVLVPPTGNSAERFMRIANVLQMSQTVGLQRLVLEPPTAGAPEVFVVSATCHAENINHATLALACEMLAGHGEEVITLSNARELLEQLGTHASGARERIWAERSGAEATVQDAEDAGPEDAVRTAQDAIKGQTSSATAAYTDYCKKVGDAR